jgi:hypothetical protein
LYFPEKPRQLDQDVIIELLEKAKAPEWHEAMVNFTINIFEMLHKKSFVYFKRLESSVGKLSQES